MDIVFPVLIVSLILIQAGFYTRAVYLRRMLMRERVLAFLDRKDTSTTMKEIVTCSFHDALNIALPFGLAEVARRRDENDAEMREIENQCEKEFSLEVSSQNALDEFGEIISLMFIINKSFNMVMYYAAFVKSVGKLTFKMNKDKVPTEIYIDAQQHMHS